MLKRKSSLLAAALIVTCSLRTSSAHADHEPAFIAGAVDVMIVLPEAILSIPNVVHVAQGRRPPLAWPVLGLVLGGIGAGLSALTLNDMRRRDQPGIAVAGLVGGGLEMTFAIWAWAQAAPVREAPCTAMRLTLSPLVVRDAASRRAYGVAIGGFTF